jgi:hypothetical protein
MCLTGKFWGVLFFINHFRIIASIPTTPRPPRPVSPAGASSVRWRGLRRWWALLYLLLLAIFILLRRASLSGIHNYGQLPAALIILPRVIFAPRAVILLFSGTECL